MIKREKTVSPARYLGARGNIRKKNKNAIKMFNKGGEILGKKVCLVGLQQIDIWWVKKCWEVISVMGGEQWG